MLFDTIKTASKLTDSVLVGFSGGKDSTVVLDLCFKYFKHVQPYFLYMVKDLEFQEKILRYYEKRYNTKILRYPHFQVSEFLAYGTCCLADDYSPIVKTHDMYNYIREETGIYWLAGGERMADSIIRNAMMKRSGSIDHKRGKIYPIAYWKKKHVMAYLKNNKLPLSLESRILGFSFRSFMPEEMYKIRKHFPKDFEKIKEVFPLIEASVKKYEYYQKEIRDADSK